MEADSTTYDECQKFFPFPVSESNLKYFIENFSNIHGKEHCTILVQRLQKLGLIPLTMQCPTKGPNCHMICERAYTLKDRIHWVCQECKARVSIRNGTIFRKLSSSLLQVMQLIMAWCEDVDIDAAANFFNIEPVAANKILLKINDAVSESLVGHRLGGPDSVVLTELYPHTVSELSPDTTVQSHSHQILMMADTNHVPTRYHLHVIKNTLLPSRLVITQNMRKQTFIDEVTEVIERVCDPASLLVRGHLVDVTRGTSLATLLENTDTQMGQFLTNGIWRQAITLCSASQDFCTKEYPPYVCAQLIQRYLSASLFRLQHHDNLYHATIKAIADSLVP